MRALRPIQNEKSFARDPVSGAVISIDKERLKAFQFSRDVQNKITELNRHIASLQDDIRQLQQTIKTLERK